jgi:peptidoglycan/xylan/chitin deacetylase (PgdA/CDA1 family)
VLSPSPLSAPHAPDGTLCLTFDDGPGVTPGEGRGPRTDRLGDYLAEEGISATFFVCGKYVRALPDVVRRLHDQGHVIGNHTTNHRELRELTLEEVRDEVVGTHDLVRDAVGIDPRYFRAPYGRFPYDRVEVLNQDPVLASYTGSVNWDVNADDWASWRDGADPEAVAEDYAQAVESVGRGIVLMHDCTADEESWQAGNATYETVRLLVPELRARGFTFAPLHQLALTESEA